MVEQCAACPQERDELHEGIRSGSMESATLYIQKSRCKSDNSSSRSTMVRPQSHMGLSEE